MYDIHKNTIKNNVETAKPTRKNMNRNPKYSE